MESETTSAPTAHTASKPDEPDPRASLRHVLVDPAPISPTSTPSVTHLQNQAPAATRTQTPPPAPGPTSAPAPVATQIQAQPADRPSAPQASQGSQGTQGPQNLAAITYTLRKNANGGVSTVYSGSKIKYLKKDDGVPFWRRDIQYAFLYHVFQDKHRVFTKLSTGTKGHTFAETYVDAMANSSRCSQILKEKLLADTSDQALDMAMVCLLVNVGRMNTTVNFFPEMRARVRTFHAIPCLQTHQSPQAYKQLQDGPRLKSILKGAMEDTPQPNNLEELANHAKPRTNPVSLIFVLAQYAPRISDLHFPAGTDFFDLFMCDTLSSKSRANALLWIIWWYLESDFSAEDSRRNPFGQGRPSDASEAMLDGLPVMQGAQMRVPDFEILTEEEAANENIDPPDELEYGERKKAERDAILASGDPIPKWWHDLTKAADEHTEQRMKAKKATGTLTPSSNSRAVDVSATSSQAETHHSNRHRNRSSSPVRPAGPRARLTPNADHTAIYEGYGSRSRVAEKEHADSRTPEPASRHRSSNGLSSAHHSRGRDTPEVELRGAYGRGSSGRRIRTPTQPFDQLYHPEQFGVTSGNTNSNSVYLGSGTSSRALLPSNTHQTPNSNAPYHSTNGHSPYQPLAPTPSATAVTTQDAAEEPPATNPDDIEQPPPSKRSRQLAERRAIEQTRHTRVTSILDNSIKAIRQAKHRERRRRGIIVDAWIKARALPDLFDSEDEAETLERKGGLDDVKPDDGIEVSITIPLATSSGNETKKVRWNPGDVGGQASTIAKTFRKLARANGIEEVVERSRRRFRDKELDEHRDDDDTKMDVDLADGEDHAHTHSGRRQSPNAYPTSNFTHKNTTLGPAMRGGGSPADDDASFTAANPPVRRKRRGPIRRLKASKASAVNEDDDQPVAPRKGQRGGRRRGASSVGTSSRIGKGGRKRKSTGDSMTVASASKKHKSGSYAWFQEPGEKKAGQSRSRQARDSKIAHEGDELEVEAQGEGDGEAEANEGDGGEAAAETDVGIEGDAEMEDGAEDMTEAKDEAEVEDETMAGIEDGDSIDKGEGETEVVVVDAA